MYVHILHLDITNLIRWDYLKSYDFGFRGTNCYSPTLAYRHDYIRAM